LVVVGVHAPEFEFGKRAENIDRGIRDHGLTYPIALDNDFATWQAFGNDAWPTKYLFDAHGRLVKRWVGEGSYRDIEAEIRRLPVAASPGTTLPPISSEATAFAKTGEPSYARITGETYLGTERREPGTVTLEGTWQSSRQYLELQNGTGKIILPFTAGEVNVVMQPGASGKAAVAVVLDGKPVGEARGADVGPDGVARFDRSGMIRLVARARRGNHVLTLVASDPGLRAYVFTFGNQPHRPPAARSQRPRTRGRPGARRLRPGSRVRQAHASGRRDHLCPRGRHHPESIRSPCRLTGVAVQ
jgi:hypothetical protein